MYAPPLTPKTGRRVSFTRLYRAAPFVVVCAFVALVLYRLVLLGQALYWGDIFLYFMPMEQVVSASLRRGQLPLWNPYVLCGQPLVGNPQAWVFYPGTALLRVMPVWLYLTVNTVVHLSLAGLGTYLFLRRACGDRLGAILGAVTFAGSGYIVSRLQFPPMTQAAAYLPWTLLLVDRLIDRPRVWYVGLMALVVALEVLAAHAQLAYLTLACASLYALARVWHVRRHRKRAALAVGALAAAAVLGVLTASVYVLPSLQLFQVSTREHLTWGQANRFVLLPEQLVNFVWPTFYGSPSDADYWGTGNAWEPCVYIGLVPLALAAYAVWRAARRPAVRFFAVLGLASLWLAMGRYGGLFWLAFYTVPGLKAFHDPARFTFLTSFAGAALAAVGLRALRDRRVGNRWRVALVCAAAVDLWWFGARFNPSLRPVAFYYRPRAMAAVPSTGQGRVFTAEREQVWKRYLSYGDYGPDSNRYAHELANTLAPNVSMRFGVEEGSGYEPVPVRAVTEVDGLVRAALARRSPALPSLLALFDASELLLPQSTRYRHPGLVLEPTAGVTVLGVRQAAPRLWLVRRTARVDGRQRTLAALSAPTYDPRRLAIVSNSPGLGNEVTEAATAPGQTRLVTSFPGRLAADVDAGPAAGFVVVSATAYPGWRALLDGRPTVLERANHAFMGACVPAGRHRLVLYYRPAVVQVALYLSLVGLAVIAAALGVGAAVRPGSRRAGGRRRGIDPGPGELPRQRSH